MKSSLHLLVVVLCFGGSQAQLGGFDYYDPFDNPTEIYRGKYIGDLSTFHHQVSVL